MRVDVSELSELPDGDRDAPLIELVLALSDAKLCKVLAYQVIVEAWRKKNSGRGKRDWIENFNDAEREVICKWHLKFRDWHLVSGTPGRIVMKLTTLELLQKAVNFFSTI